jgi:putative transcriptional regulator
MDYERRRLRLKAHGRIVELRDGRELTFAPDAPSITPSASERPAVPMLRERAQLTQTEFAARLVCRSKSSATGSRASGCGPARALLTLVAAAPESVFATLAGASTQGR